ncbi:SKA complex subunit 1 [Aplochiton taeniatus]
MTHRCELEDVTQHINNKISSLKQILELRSIAKDPDKILILRKIGQDVLAIDGLLDQFEKCVGRQKGLLKHLKDLQSFFEEDLQDGQHLRENIPQHMPKNGLAAVGSGSQNKPAEVQPVQQDNSRKTSKNQIREMQFITMPEFEAIPQYMKGRVTYDQLNGVVQSINTASVGKYKILQQPLKNLNNHTRRLHQRFKDEETKDTKGQFFVVEADLREFTQMKVDKRFQGILNMLRHCQRLRELRGGGLTRYLLL